MSEKPGKRLVSKSRYVYSVGISMSLYSLAGLSYLGSALTALLAVCGFFTAWFGHSVSALFTSMSVVVVAAYLFQLGRSMTKKAAILEQVIPITRHNTGDLPEVETLVRPSGLLPEYQNAELLRATEHSTQTSPELLLRSAQETKQMAKRWKLITVFIAVSAVVLGACVLIRKAQERQEFVSSVDPISGYRCRFLLSPNWQHFDSSLTVRPGPTLRSSHFTRPPNPVRLWIDSHFRPNRADLSPTITLFNTYITTNARVGDLENYPEPAVWSSQRVETVRHLKIDDCPATVFTARAGTARTTGLVVAVPGQSFRFNLVGSTENSSMPSIDGEMQTIISSFHMEKIPPAPSGKR